MMANTPRFSHAGGTDDDRGVAQFVQLHRVRNLTDVGQIFHPERVLFLAKKLVDAVVETFRMEPIDLGGVDAERAIHKNRYSWQLLGQRELVERIDDLLRPADR